MSSAVGYVEAPTTRVEKGVPPWRMLAVVAFALGGIAAIGGMCAPSEAGGVALSAITALGAWSLAQRWLAVRSYGRSFVLLLNALLAVKVLANLLHFYFVFAPAAGIASAAQAESADYLGDLIPIHQAAEIFAKERGAWGLVHALIGDYYRGINNPGVGIVYGLLYGAFGSYPTVAIPWNAFAMGAAALAIGEIARESGLGTEVRKSAMVLTVLLPTFFVACPVYRDQFMLMLLVMAAYAATDGIGNGRLLSLIVSVIGGVALQYLRSVYLLIPLFGMAGALLGKSAKRKGYKIFGILLVVGMAVLWYVLLPEGIEREWQDRLEGREIVAGLANEVIGAKGLGGMIARTSFVLLTPMPWWQKAPASILAYQLFDYAETVVSLAMICCMVASMRRVPWNAASLACYSIGLWLLIVVIGGSDLHQRYLQVGLPLVMLPAYAEYHRKRALWYGAAIVIVALAHAIILTR